MDHLLVIFFTLFHRTFSEFLIIALAYSAILEIQPIIACLGKQKSRKSVRL